MQERLWCNFRAYNDVVAYRFYTKKKGELIVKNEAANFNFVADHKAFIPIQWDYRGGKIFNSSFESLYREINLSQFPKDSLAFLPLLGCQTGDSVAYLYGLSTYSIQNESNWQTVY